MWEFCEWNDTISACWSTLGGWWNGIDIKVTMWRKVEVLNFFRKSYQCNRHQIEDLPMSSSSFTGDTSIPQNNPINNVAFLLWIVQQGSMNFQLWVTLCGLRHQQSKQFHRIYKFSLWNNWMRETIELFCVWLCVVLLRCTFLAILGSFLGTPWEFRKLFMVSGNYLSSSMRRW